MANTSEQLMDKKLNYLNNTKFLIKQVLIEQGVDVLDTDTFRDYANKIRELNNGEVYLFETLQEMYDFPNPKDNALAIIYQTTSNTFELYDLIQYVILDNEVTIPQECTENYTAQIINSNNIEIGNLQISPTMFKIQVTYPEINIQYISEDGISYTLNTEITNPINFNTEVTLQLSDKSQLIYFKPFIKHENGNLAGIYRFTNNTFVDVSTQLERELNETYKMLNLIRLG